MKSLYLSGFQAVQGEKISTKNLFRIFQKFVYERKINDFR
nr:MAG TPA: hypothetical protein [Caudoviricetes sp.]